MSKRPIKVDEGRVRWNRFRLLAWVVVGSLATVYGCSFYEHIPILNEHNIGLLRHYWGQNCLQHVRIPVVIGYNLYYRLYKNDTIYKSFEIGNNQVNTLRNRTTFVVQPNTTKHNQTKTCMHDHEDTLNA